MKTDPTDLHQYFTDRHQAGVLLGEKLKKDTFRPHMVVTIPRGGVPVALAVADILGIPLRLCLIRKIGHPLNPECAIGATSETDILLKTTNAINPGFIDQSIYKERARINTIKGRIGHTFSNKEIKGKTILLVDDGIATGNCMELAIQILQKAGALKIGIAVPVCPTTTRSSLQKKVDYFISLLTPDYFSGVGAYYEDFSQLTDEAVIDLLREK